MTSLFDRTVFIYLLPPMMAVYLAIMSFTGLWPWQANAQNAYALQAQAWLQGRLDLSPRPGVLQIAEYKGRYYVSFPPVPSLVVLPFVALVGPALSPDHFLNLIAGFVAAWYAYRIGRRLGHSGREAAFWGLFVTVGSNFLFISIRGSVWYLAQSFSFALSMAAIYYALSPRYSDGFLTMGLYALSIGCRPTQLIFFPVIAWLLFEKPQGLRQKTHGLWWLLPALGIGAAYAWLNFARFDHPLEFGHNYLPEFIAAPHGQFSLEYFQYNWPHLFFLPPVVNGRVRFPIGVAFAFFISSPIFLSFLLEWGRSWMSFPPRKPLQQILLPSLLFLFMVVIACHQTLGGIQFGNRYMVDVLPYLLLGLLQLFNRRRISSWHTAFHQWLFFVGVALNTVGGIAFFNQWI